MKLHFCSRINKYLKESVGETISVPGLFSDRSYTQLMRLVLLGLSGVGKSAAGNTILGREAFRSGLSSRSLTLRSESGAADVCGRRVTVVDTPGLFNTELSEQQLRAELERAVSLCGPGPHAFLLVLQLGRLTQQERSAVETLQELLSDRVSQYTVLLFTHGDELRNTNIDQFIKQDENLQQLVRKCGNRYQLVNNREKSDCTQVRGLLEKVEDMFSRNRINHYDLQRERAADRRRRWKICASVTLLGLVIGAAIGFSVGEGAKGATLGALIGTVPGLLTVYFLFFSPRSKKGSLE
ncbi:GIMA4 GTPase, partial [Amia calva]|nr:GIMA4 GTPase [Amia calva]